MGISKFFNDAVARVKTTLTYTLADAVLRDDVQGVRRLMGEKAPDGAGIPAYNSHCLLIAAENGSYNAMREMLTLSAENNCGPMTTPMSFALGKEWDRFEQLAKTDPVIALAVKEHDTQLEAAFQRFNMAMKAADSDAGPPAKQAAKPAARNAP